MNYKLRIYKTTGADKGDLDHEEFFETKTAMDKRYDEIFEYSLFSLNPTAWNYDGNWNRIAGY